VAQTHQGAFAPLGALAIGTTVMWTILWIVGDLASPVASLLGTVLACGTGLFVISRSYYEKRLLRPFTCVVMLVFIVKIGIGIAHYLYFFDPGYFSSPLGYFPWIFDYGQLPDGMQRISEYWREYGLTGLPKVQIVGKTAVLAAYHAMLYYLCGEHFLMFVPWASFHTILVGFLITSFALQRGATARQATAAFVLTSLQPLFWYTDLPQRDIVGQFFVILAAYLVVNSLGKVRRMALVLPLAILLVYAQRWAYPFVVVAQVITSYFLAKRKAILAIASICAFIIAWWIAGAWIVDATLAKYSGVHQFDASNLPITSIDRVPAGILVGIIGPFPWTQLFIVKDAFIHLPPNMIQAGLGLVTWMVVVPVLWRQWKATKMLDDLAIFSGLYSISGMMTEATHTGYVHIATVLLLPMACKVPGRVWARNVIIVCMLYIIGNVLFWGLGLEGKGWFAR
jgi:hypothetical protein